MTYARGAAELAASIRCASASPVAIRAISSLGDGTGAAPSGRGQPLNLALEQREPVLGGQPRVAPGASAATKPRPGASRSSGVSSTFWYLLISRLR